MCKQCLINEAKKYEESNPVIPFYIPGILSEKEYIQMNYSNHACWIYDLYNQMCIEFDEANYE